MEMCIEKNIVSGKLPYDNFSVLITLVKAAKKLGWKESLVKYYVASLKKRKCFQETAQVIMVLG